MAKLEGDGLQSTARTTDIAPRSMTLTTEAPYASATGVNRDPASFTIKLWPPAGASTAEGTSKVIRGSSTVGALGAYPGAPTTYSCLWLGPGSTLTNGGTAAIFADGAANSYLNVASGGTVGLAIGGGDQIALTAANISITPPIIQWKSTVLSPNLSQSARTTDAAPQNLTVTPQAPWASATGVNRMPGSFVVELAVPTNGGVNEGAFKVTRSATFAAQIAPLDTAPTVYTAMWLTPGVSPSTSNYSFAHGAGALYANSGTSINLIIGAVASSGVSVTSSSVTLYPVNLQWDSAVVSPKIWQANDATNGITADTLTIQAQNATGTTSTGGNLQFRSGTGTSANGYIQFYSGSTLLGQTHVAGGTYWAITANAASGFVFYANVSGQGITFQSAAANGYATFDTDTVNFGYNAAAYNLTFKSPGTSATISQATHATDAHLFKIQAGNVTTGTGSELRLQSGTGSVAAGNVTLYAGNSIALPVAPETATTWSSASDGYVLLRAGSGARAEWGTVDAGVLTTGGANQVLWSNGSANSWTGAPTVTSIGASSYVSIGATPAITGQLRFSHTDFNVKLRNITNTADLNIVTIDAGTGTVMSFGDSTIYVNLNAGGGVYVNAGSLVLRTTAGVGTATFNCNSGQFNWDATTLSPLISQTTHATTPHTFTLQAQNVTTGTGSALKLQSGSGSVADGQIQFFSGTTQLGTMSLVAGAYWGFSASTTSGYAFYANSSGQGITFQAAAANGYARFDADTIGFGYNAATYAVTFRATGTAINITQAQRASDTATATLTIQAQNAWGSATGTNRNGGHLDLKAGTKATGGSDGQVRIYSGGGWLGAQIANGQVSFYGSTEIDFFMGGTFRTLIDGSAWRLKNGCQLRWDNENTAPQIQHSPHTTDTAPGNFTIWAQDAWASATGANRKGGDLILKAGTTTSGGTVSRVRMYSGATSGASIEMFNLYYDSPTSMATLTTISGHIMIMPPVSSSVYIRAGSTAGDVVFDTMQATGSLNFRTGAGGTEVLKITNGFAGFRVAPLAGTTVNVKGTGATSATYSLICQNDNSQSLFYVRDDGITFFGAAASVSARGNVQWDTGASEVRYGVTGDYAQSFVMGATANWRVANSSGTSVLHTTGGGNVGLFNGTTYGNGVGVIALGAATSVPNTGSISTVLIYRDSNSLILGGGDAVYIGMNGGTSGQRYHKFSDTIVSFFSATPLPGDDAWGVIFVGENSDIPASAPTGGFDLFCLGGCPTWITSAGDGIVWSSTVSTSATAGLNSIPDTCVEYLEIIRNGNVRKIPLFSA